MTDKIKKEEMSDLQFIVKYVNFMNEQIKQMELELTAAKLNRKHIISIKKKLRKKK